MNNDDDIFLCRKLLAQTLFTLSSRQLTKFRELFPTPIQDTQVRTALKLAIGYPAIDPDTTSITNKKQWRAKKKMIA